MKKNTKGKTYACIVLDTSTSMGSTAEAAVEGYNEHVEEFWKWDDDPEVDLYVSLVTFNTEVYEHLWNVPAKELKKSTYESFKPSGWTAFLDGQGYAIDKLIETVKPGPDDAFLMIVISDGDENKSKHVTSQALKAKIQECEASGKWTFTYMGCDMSNLMKVHRETGIPLANMAAWQNKTERGTKHAMHENVNKLAAYRDTRKRGVQMCNSYHSDVAGVAADYISTADTADRLPDYAVSNLLWKADANVSLTSGTFGSESIVAKVNPTGAVDVFTPGGQVNANAYVRWTK